MFDGAVNEWLQDEDENMSDEVQPQDPITESKTVDKGKKAVRFDTPVEKKMRAK